MDSASLVSGNNVSKYYRLDVTLLKTKHTSMLYIKDIVHKTNYAYLKTCVVLY